MKLAVAAPPAAKVFGECSVCVYHLHAAVDPVGRHRPAQRVKVNVRKALLRMPCRLLRVPYKTARIAGPVQLNSPVRKGGKRGGSVRGNRNAVGQGKPGSVEAVGRQPEIDQELGNIALRVDVQGTGRIEHIVDRPVVQKDGYRVVGGVGDQ